MKKFQKIPENELIEAIKTSISYREVFDKLKNYISNGPENWNNLKSFIESNNIDISHFDKNWYSKSRKKYQDIIKICPACSKEYSCSSGGKRYKKTCSKRCSNSYFASKRMTAETKQKIREGVNSYLDKNPKKKLYLF